MVLGSGDKDTLANFFPSLLGLLDVGGESLSFLGMLELAQCLLQLWCGEQGPE